MASARKAAAIAEACRAYLEAHDRRAPGYPHMTVNESAALSRILNALTASVPEDELSRDGMAV